MNEQMGLAMASTEYQSAASRLSRELIERRVIDSIAVKQAMLEPELVDSLMRLSDEVSASLRAGGKLILFGNGGSAADATHVAAEFVGRFAFDRDPLAAMSLSDNVSSVTAIGNDFGYESTFSRQIRAFGSPGDVAIALSTSGTSVNVLTAIEAAREASMFVAVFTGTSGGDMAALADIGFVVPSTVTARIQEAYMLYAHILCEGVERELFGWSAAAAAV
jgi:D-sedoheptulose 7-phosphate isomerase